MFNKLVPVSNRGVVNLTLQVNRSNTIKPTVLTPLSSGIKPIKLTPLSERVPNRSHTIKPNIKTVENKGLAPVDFNKLQPLYREIKSNTKVKDTECIILPDGMGLKDYYDVFYNNPGTKESIERAIQELIDRSNNTNSISYISEGMKYIYHYSNKRRETLRQLAKYVTPILANGTKTGMLTRRARVTFTLQSEVIANELVEGEDNIKKLNKEARLDVDKYGNKVKMLEPNYEEIYFRKKGIVERERLNVILGGISLEMTPSVEEYVEKKILKLERNVQDLEEIVAKHEENKSKAATRKVRGIIENQIKERRSEIEDIRNRMKYFLSEEAETMLSEGIIPDEISRKRLSIALKIKIGAAILARTTGVPIVFRLKHELNEDYQYEQDNVVYIVYPDLKIENIPDKRKLYGYYRYALPENNHGFNTESNLDCILTGLLKNPFYNKHIELDAIIKTKYDVNEARITKGLDKLLMVVYSKMGIAYLEELFCYDELKNKKRMRLAHQILAEISGKEYIIVYKTTRFDLASERERLKLKDLKERRDLIAQKDEILDFILETLQLNNIKIDPRCLNRKYHPEIKKELESDIEPRYLEGKDLKYIKDTLQCYYNQDIEQESIIPEVPVEIVLQPAKEWIPTVKDHIDEALRVLKIIDKGIIDREYTDEDLLTRMSLDEIDRLNLKTSREYIKYPENKPVKLRDYPDDKKVPRFKVRLHDGHVFNENTKEAGRFLSDNIMFVERNENKTVESNIDRRRKRLQKRPDSKKMKNKLAWNGVLRSAYLSHQKKNPDIIYKTIRINSNQEYISSVYGDFMSIEEYKKRMEAEPEIEKAIGKEVLDDIKKSIKKDKKIYSEPKNVKYVAADLETVNIVSDDGKKVSKAGCLRTTPYSIAWEIFKKLEVVEGRGFLYNKIELTHSQIIEFLDIMIDCAEEEIKIFFHYGSRFDIHLLKEHIYNTLAVRGIEILEIGKTIISFCFIYKGKKISMVDSIKLLGCPIKKMKETYGVDIIDKQNYPYEFYQKLHMMEYLSPKPKSEDCMIAFADTIEGLAVENRDRFKTNIDHRNVSIEDIYRIINTKVSFQDDRMIPVMIKEMDKFISTLPIEYVKANKFDLVKLCEDYNISDCTIMTQGLLAFKKIFTNNEKLIEILKSLNPGYISVYRESQTGSNGMGNYEICIQRREYINPLDCLTIPSFVNTILKEQNIFRGACKVKEGLADYINTNVRGGQVHSTELRKRFTSRIIEEIVTNPYFYIQPTVIDSETKNVTSMEDVIKTLSKYGYDEKKTLLRYYIDDPPEEVKRLRYLLESYGSCLVDLDGVSLYPSAISMSMFPIGSANKFKEAAFKDWEKKMCDKQLSEKLEYETWERKMFESIDLRYNNINPDLHEETLKNINYEFWKKTVATPEILAEVINWMGTFRLKLGKIRPGRLDLEGNIIEEFPMLTIKTPMGKKQITDEVDSYSMDNISFIEFRKYYPDAEYTFLNGVYWSGASVDFAEIIKILFDLRLHFKSLKMTAVANQIKLLLNSAFGKLIQKEKFTETKFLSRNTYTIEYAKWKKVYDKLISDNKIKFNDIKVYDKWVNIGYILAEKKEGSITENRIEEAISEYRYDIDARVKILRSKADNQEEYIKNEVFKIIWEKLKEGCDNDYIKYCENHAHLMENLEQLTVECKNITDIVKKFSDTRKHESMPHWAMVLLSNSKKLMNDMMEKIYWDIYYTDTDSIHCDGSYMLHEEVLKMVGENLCQFHSDFSILGLNPHNNKDGLKPLNDKIGLCSILSLFAGKKKYLDTVMGVNIDETEEGTDRKLGYITASFHKKFNGGDSNRFTFEKYEEYIDGKPIEQDSLEDVAFRSTICKTHNIRVTSSSLGHKNYKKFQDEKAKLLEKEAKLLAKK